MKKVFSFHFLQKMNSSYTREECENLKNDIYSSGVAAVTLGEFCAASHDDVICYSAYLQGKSCADKAAEYFDHCR